MLLHLIERNNYYYFAAFNIALLSTLHQTAVFGWIIKNYCRMIVS